MKTFATEIKNTIKALGFWGCCVVISIILCCTGLAYSQVNDNYILAEMSLFGLILFPCLFGMIECLRN